MKVFIFVFLLLFTLSYNSIKADEGLLLPSYLSNHIVEMQKAGLKLSAEDIYSINEICLKDAVVGLTSTDQFSTSCTASFVSTDGLLLTNYHCVISHIERYSTTERNFLKYGLWTSKREEEPTCHGLQALRLVKMMDVTDEIYKDMTPEESANFTPYLNAKGKKIVARETAGTPYQGIISSFFAGNQFILSIYERYTDIRLAAAPPMQIGKFGNETDNWNWPRYTGDFAFLRVYDKEGSPIKSPNHLRISTATLKDNDFVMAMGFPGQTRFYIPAYALQEMANGELQIRASLRKQKLELLDDILKREESKKLRYSTTQGSLQNTYLRTVGEIEGIRATNLVDKKRAEEDLFRAWAGQDTARTQYAEALDRTNEIYEILSRYNQGNTYFEEVALYGADLIPFAGKFEKMMRMFDRKKINYIAIKKEAESLKALTKQALAHWDADTDREIFAAMLYAYYTGMPAEFHPKEVTNALLPYDGDIEAFLKEGYANSILTDEAKLLDFLDNMETEGRDKLYKDPLYQTAIGFYRTNVEKINPMRRELQSHLSESYSLYLKGLLEMNAQQLIPDANKTLRVSYGRIMPVNNIEGRTLKGFSYAADMLQNWNNEPAESTHYIPSKLRELLQKKQYGRYFSKKTPINFAANIHTSSGNSGSPVLNAKGELIGINFDRVKDGVVSDYRYSSEYSRSITVNIAYVLFILEQYSHSKQLLDELDIVR